MQKPGAVVIQGAERATGSVIWLHGLGADGHDFEPLVPELAVGALAGLRFVFPHAPVRPVTINGGMSMRAWYDILTLERSGPVDEAGIRDSAAILAGYVEREREQGVPSERIVVAGFSQGGAIALHAGLRFPHRLAGLMALSTYLPLRSALQSEVADNPAAQPREVPIFMAHGQFDAVLPQALGSESCEVLRNTGYAVEWHSYPMAHAVCPQEVADIRRWLQGVYGDR